jgi:hypothetical protein
LVEKLLTATPEKSDRQIAETVKVDHKTVGAWRAEKEGRGEIPHVSSRTDSKGRKQAAHKQTTTTKPPAESPAVIAAADQAEARARKGSESASEKKPPTSDPISKFVSDFEARIIDAMKPLNADECAQLIKALRSEINNIESEAATRQQVAACRALEAVHAAAEADNAV